ncbi:hypothetical protein [Mesorhizobium sp. B4-1-1]|uniref:hypothetical protein n=1 Tax=Mesorhizobium sp. B4-1-1 TaxID=2589890 RepID=UPI001126650C|nr:hypothetical protein [Mesorhizobium sp. B4-1-1]TPI17611.1 hypothetical protein FJW10_21495 [Mesorhizobium sp. B4-1-1]
MIFIDHQAWLLESIKYNFTWEGTRDWIGATSGWAAAAFAAATIYVLWRQVDQVRQAERDRSRGIANTILIDVLDTGLRLPKITHLHELDPPMSDLSRGMINDATRVAPELAAALQRHCREIGAFESLIRSRTGRGPGAITAALLSDARSLAFRATVLSWCFGIASEQIAKKGRATGHFIDQKNLDRIKQHYNAQDDDMGFLEQLFEASPVGS